MPDEFLNIPLPNEPLGTASNTKNNLSGNTSNSKKNDPGVAIQFLQIPKNEPSTAPETLKKNETVPSINLAETDTAQTSQKEPKKTNGSFENIFAEKPKEKEQDSGVIHSILGQESLKKLKPILGPAPVIEKNIEKEKMNRLRKKMRRVQVLFLSIFFMSVASAAYFYVQLAPNFDLFGANATQKLADTNASLRELNTTLLKNRYLGIQLLLNDFGYQADRFFGNVILYNDPNISSDRKKNILADMNEARAILPSLLDNIRTELNKNVVIPTFRSDAEPEKTPEQLEADTLESLRGALRKDRAKFNNSTTFEDIQNAKLLGNALKLVGNTSLKTQLQQISIDNFEKDLDDYQRLPSSQKEKDLRDLTSRLLSSTQSDLAVIADVKQSRIDWSTIIRQIEAETTNVDKNYGQPVLYENLGGVQYTGYEFDAIANKIVLSGTAKTLDGKNFTLLSNLIDQLEQSLHFQDVNMRNFAKNKTDVGTSNEGYITNFKIDLRLESDHFSDKNRGISLESTNPTQNGVKR